jgi:hypothetical protein
MSAPQNKGYKRSWKNLLLNKRYQLRFTLFMVALSAVLMGLLGWWVMKVAGRATEVSINNVLGGEVCRDPARDAAAAPAPAPAPAPEVDTGRAKPVVTLDESEMQIIEPPPVAEAEPLPGPVDSSAVLRSKFEDCKDRQAAKIKDLENRQRLIFWVLIAVGTMMVVGLLFYGIKMTHRVAGPLHKVALYMGKLKDGRYDAVYNLRKGDHLVEFYEHFKQAHAGMKKWQLEDIERLKALIAAAEEAKLAGRSPEMAAALADLRALLDKKEASLG